MNCVICENKLNVLRAKVHDKNAEYIKYQRVLVNRRLLDLLLFYKHDHGKYINLLNKEEK